MGFICKLNWIPHLEISSRPFCIILLTEGVVVLRLSIVCETSYGTKAARNTAAAMMSPSTAIAEDSRTLHPVFSRREHTGDNSSAKETERSSTITICASASLFRYIAAIVNRAAVTKINGRFNKPRKTLFPFQKAAEHFYSAAAAQSRLCRISAHPLRRWKKSWCFRRFVPPR